MHDSKLTPGEENTLQSIAQVLKDAGAHVDPYQDILSAHNVSIHLLAQQIAFFSVKQPSMTFKENYLKNTFQKLSQLISDYEKEIEKCQSNSTSKISEKVTSSIPNSEQLT
jgi:hypothetical protein